MSCTPKLMVSEREFCHLNLANASFPTVFTDVNAAYSDFTDKLSVIVEMSWMLM